MRICIYGAGAGGGHFAVKLAKAGHEVSVIARGSHLAAIKKDGLQLREDGNLLKANVGASDEPKPFGPQDVVIVAVKTPALAAVAPQLVPLLRDDTLVVFPQNGMTWWYPLGLPDHCPRPPALPIFSLADGFLRAMRPEQVMGGIIYSANEIEAPGIIRNNSPGQNHLTIGPIDSGETSAIEKLRAALEQAGIRSKRPRDIRQSVWEKLLTNMSGSVIALVTASNSDACRDDPALSEIYRRVVREGVAIAAAHGFALAERMDPERMLARLVNHKPSLLQDYEQSRPMEIGEMVLAPLAFARAQNIATPTLDTLAAIAARMAVDRGLYPKTEIEKLRL